MLIRTKLILYLFSFFSIVTFGQQSKVQFENFFLKERKIVWQKVYQTEKSQNEISDYFKRQTLTNNLQLMDSTLIGKSNLTRASSNKGYTWSFSDFEMFITIDIKKGRYRVTLKDFNYKPIQTGINSGLFSISTPVSTTLSKSFVRNNKDEFRKNNSSKNYLKILNNDFEKAFSIKEIKKEKDDW